MERVKEDDIKVDRLSLLRLVYWNTCFECHEFFFGLWNNTKVPMFKFPQSVFDDLMGVIAFEVMENDVFRFIVRNSPGDIDS